MIKIIFLIENDLKKYHNDNHIRLPKAFEKLGCMTKIVSHNDVYVRSNNLFFGHECANNYDLIWPIGFGNESTFLDRVQLLELTKNVPLVNNPRSMTFLHGKQTWLQYMPETHVSNDIEFLKSIIDQGGDWICKPTASSFGKDVSLCKDGDDPNEILQSLTRNNKQVEPKYCMIQRYIDEIKNGELRTIIAAGKVIGSYLRIPRDGLRANLNANADIEKGVPNTYQERLIDELSSRLLENGILFAAIDLVGNYLMEVNIANPGGLESLKKIYGSDPDLLTAKHILDKIISK